VAGKWKMGGWAAWQPWQRLKLCLSRWQYCHIRHINQSGHTDCNKYAGRLAAHCCTAGVCAPTTIFQTRRKPEKMSMSPSLPGPDSWQLVWH